MSICSYIRNSVLAILLSFKQTGYVSRRQPWSLSKRSVRCRMQMGRLQSYGSAYLREGQNSVVNLFCESATVLGVVREYVYIVTCVVNSIRSDECFF